MLIFIRFFLNSLNPLWSYIFLFQKHEFLSSQSQAAEKIEPGFIFPFYGHLVHTFYATTHGFLSFAPRKYNYKSIIFILFWKKNFWHKNSFHKFFVWHNFSQFLPLQEKCKNCKKINLIDLIPIFSKDPQFDVQNAIYSSPKSEIRSRKI